jgi:chromosome partitioning protein
VRGKDNPLQDYHGRGVGNFKGQLKVFNSMIPNTVKVGESIYYSQPLQEYAPESKACEAYLGLAREVIAYES